MVFFYIPQYHVMMIQCSMQQKHEVDMGSMGRLFHFQLRHQSSGSYHRLYHRRVQCSGRQNTMIGSGLKFMTLITGSGNESYLPSVTGCSGSGRNLRATE